MDTIPRPSAAYHLAPKRVRDHYGREPLETGVALDFVAHTVASLDAVVALHEARADLCDGRYGDAADSVERAARAARPSGLCAIWPLYEWCKRLERLEE